MTAHIFVLAGVNGAGKSSVGGAALQASGLDYFNPDRAARTLLQSNPALTAEAANAQAWDLGRAALERALANGENFAFETTLGANTIPRLLLEGAQRGARVSMWYAGLASPELHIQRVRSRVAAGGHDVPESRIRERYLRSLANLIRLLPHLASLRVYDNSSERDPKTGLAPQPVLLLHMKDGRTAYHCPLGDVPDWAKPVLAQALA